MPEYLAPGVYIEETSYRAKTIEGVSTSTAGFVGPARFGPTSGVPELVTSFAEFERKFGGMEPLEFEEGANTQTNFLAQAVRAFFDNGGVRLYIARLYQKLDSSGEDISAQGYAAGALASAESQPTLVTFRARYPGKAGNLRVTVTAQLTADVKTGQAGEYALKGVSDGDTVWIGPRTGPSSANAGTLYWAERGFDDAEERVIWTLHDEAENETSLDDVSSDDAVRVLTVTVQVVDPDNDRRSALFEGLTLDPHSATSLSSYFAEELSNRSHALARPVIFEPTEGANGPRIAGALLGGVLDRLADRKASAAQRRVTVSLTGGDDGDRPTQAAYAGNDDDPAAKTGLKAFEDMAEISIVAAPGYSYVGTSTSWGDQALAIAGNLVSHAETMRYRIAVLDAPEAQDLTGVQEFRGQLDSSHAALYYPWVQILDSVSNAQIALPPSGFMAGIYARNDVQKGVHKAPANEVVTGALGFEVLLNKAQQDILNPNGINCLRFFEGRGYRVWGARTISSDPEWKYVNLRRYFAYLERSIERGTQWVVFENNGPTLWANVKRTIEDFLFNEWKSDHLLGEKPEDAYFVRCDRSTMSQNDLDNGRLICLIGVAPLRPAEFVIFRIGQWTGSAKS